MPKRLPERWRAESTLEFRDSARERFDDALALAAAGRRTGAIYLWGYCVEMILKAAYFSMVGIPDNHPITWPGDIQPAIIKGRSIFGIVWPNRGAGHNVRAWSELLVAERVNLGAAYSAPMDIMVQSHGQRVGQLWRESLRYHKNVAYLHELARVRNAAEWFLVNSDIL